MDEKEIGRAFVKKYNKKNGFKCFNRDGQYMIYSYFKNGIFCFSRETKDYKWNAFYATLSDIEDGALEHNIKIGYTKSKELIEEIQSEWRSKNEK